MSTTSDFVNSVCEVLFANGGSIASIDGMQNLWTNSTLDIGNAWLHEDEGGLQDVVEGLNSTQALNDFFSNMSSYPLNDWCLDTITLLQTKIAANWDDQKSGVWNGMTSQQASLIQATSGQETATGDSEGKATQSALQNATSAGQPASNAGDSVIGVLSNGSSVQAQISA